MLSHQTILRSAGRCAQVFRRLELVPFLPALLLALSAPGGGTLPAIAAMFLLGATLIWRDTAGRGAEDAGRDTGDGLPPVEVAVAAADRAIASAPRLGRSTIVLAVGIDGFETLAARHGAAAAEEFARRTGQHLQGALRGADRLARLDGAAFAVVLGPIRRADIDVALQVAARLQAAAATPAPLASGLVEPTVSVGFCLGLNAVNGAAALAAASAALAEARLAGPASIRAHAPGRPARAARPDALDADVVAALEDGEIRPWFQPQIACADGAVSGFEALARWEHPERGIIAPAQFLPVLEAAGLLDRLGRAMLFQGFTAMRDWTRAGLFVPRLGINFSADELRDPRLAERIGWDLDRFDLTPDRLAVEVLESVVAGPGDDSVRRTIADLSRLGCTIDLDDFGTGSASLAAVSRFAIGRIKIDRSFVAGLDRDPGRRRMVAAILDLAQRLEVDTVAEGVERVGEHTMLAELGCGHVQGFGIARPMPFAETIAWMERHAGKLALPATLRRRTT